MTVLKTAGFTIWFLLLCVLGVVAVPIGFVLLMLAGFALLGLLFAVAVWEVVLTIVRSDET